MSGNEIITLCPSRGRPSQCRAVMKSHEDTREFESSKLVVIVDQDDPCLEKYQDHTTHFNSVIFTTYPPRGRITAILNEDAAFWSNLSRPQQPSLIGFVADDGMFRTESWDEKLLRYSKDRHPVIIYPNDLYQGEKLPVFAWLSPSIVRAVGFCAPFYHLGFDDVWNLWGKTLGPDHYIYCPEIIVEHMHPAVGKAKHDAGYEKANGEYSQAQLSIELPAYVQNFKRKGGDYYKLRALLSDLTKEL